MQIEEYTDSQMLMAMANENAREEPSLTEQEHMMIAVKEYLKDHPEECRISHDRPKHLPHSKGLTQSHRPHEHGSVECVVAFLGEENWRPTKVKALLAISEKLDVAVKSMVAKRHEALRVIMPGKIGIESAAAIAQLEKTAQRAAGEVIVKAGEEQMRNEKKNGRTRAVITPEQVLHAVKQAKHVTRSMSEGAARAEHQSRLVTEEMDRAIKRNIRDAELERVKDGNEEALRLARKLCAVLPLEIEMQKLIAVRHLINPASKMQLESALEEVAQRLLHWRNDLRKAPALRLT